MKAAVYLPHPELTRALSSPEFWDSDTAAILSAQHAAAEAEELAGLVTNTLSAAGLLFFQTSGSEGSAKWVGLSRQAVLTSARAVNFHLECSEADRWLLALPLHHVGGFSILARCREAGSSHVQWQGKWDAVPFTQSCREHHCTLASLVPTQVYDLVQQKIPAPDSLRAVVVGGGALAENIGRAAQALGWRVLQSYGMTETASQVATEPLEHLHSGFAPNQMEVLPCWDLSTDAEGRLQVRGDALATGYAIRDSSGNWQWQEFDTAEGLITRDYVSLWKHGTRQYLEVLGRESAFVKVRGELVNVSTVQARVDALAQAMALPVRVVVCPVPDPRHDTLLVLVAETAAATLYQDLFTDLIRSHDAACPPAERLYHLRTVEFLPVSELGKIQLASLQKQLTAME